MYFGSRPPMPANPPPVPKNRRSLRECDNRWGDGPIRRNLFGSNFTGHLAYLPPPRRTQRPAAP